MPPLPVHLHYRTAAIVLNNMGVSLIERRCYRQAIDALNDSAALMKIAFSLRRKARNPDSRSKEQASIPPSCWPNTRDLLRKASQSLFHPKPDVDVSLSDLAPLADLRVITLEESDVAVEQVLKEPKEQREDSATFLIRINESSATNDFPPSRALDTENLFLLNVEGSVILYNSGTALQRMASTVSSVSPEKCNKKALRLMELSLAVFPENFDFLGFARDDAEMSTEHIPLAILFLLNMLKLTSRTRGRETEAMAFELKLSEATEIFFEEQELNLLGAGRRNTARAA